MRRIVDVTNSHSSTSQSRRATRGNIEGHPFRLSLIRDPRFGATVNDIVVEFGNGRYQDLMDRFVRGDVVGDEALRHVWEDTTNVNPDWRRPIYQEFFRAVRAVNVTLPSDRQLRVLLGDPPIEWETIHTRDDLRAATRALPDARFSVNAAVKPRARRTANAMPISTTEDDMAQGNPYESFVAARCR